jgi:hypothetical protein
LNFWITLISCILYNNILYLPTIYLTSMIIYKILRSKFNE